MKELPKASHNRGNQYTKCLKDTAVPQPDTKLEIIESAGFTKKQAQRFETLASHPEIVEQVKAEARENDDIVSRSQVRVFWHCQVKAVVFFGIILRKKSEYSGKCSISNSSEERFVTRLKGGAVSQKSAKAVDTQKELAKAVGVSHDTIAKAKKRIEAYLGRS